MTYESRIKYMIGVLYESKTSLTKCFLIKLMHAFTKSMWSEYSPRIRKYTGEYLIRFYTSLLVNEDQTSFVPMKQRTIIQWQSVIQHEMLSQIILKIAFRFSMCNDRVTAGDFCERKREIRNDKIWDRTQL
jgi:hypothetical protein